ncbi:hypothetical protein R50073_17130 [Maricurvus nonylphenolicus]|uniref:YybH family protein n=1 Tax=Maricurvus nonylphenolicus TaxID=1008307 RepID=UPI0036F3D6D8
MDAVAEGLICRDPAEIHRLFIISLLKQDIDGALSLYHMDAHFVSGPGTTTVSGHEAVREQLEVFATIAGDMKLVERTMTVAGDIAQVKMQWKRASTGEAFTALDVLQRQDDGRWLFLIDNPYGA